MKKFIKENWFKLLMLVILVIVILFSLFYFNNVRKPKIYQECSIKSGSFIPGLHSAEEYLFEKCVKDLGY